MNSPALSPQRNVQILVAEDSPTQAQRLVYILTQRGYSVVAAVNGREALDMARQLRPALIISDVVMPEMDGYTLTRHIKSDPELRGTPVILVTTMSDPQDVIRGLECGADCFILKPYDEQHLVGRVHYILLNREFRQTHDSGMGVEIHFNGQRHYITADRLQILNLLLSTYDAAIQRNQELSQSQEALERKTAEEQAGRRFLDSIFENIPVAVFMKDADDLRYVRVNRAAEALMGCPREAMLGKSSAEVYSAEHEEHLRLLEREALETGRIQDVPRMDITTYDKGVRSVRVRMVPVLETYGEATHLLKIWDDITDDVAAEAELKALNTELQALNAELQSVNAELVRRTEELEHARQAAEEATRAKSAFLATMSHEIRTPMNGVIGMVDVLHQTSLKGPQVEMVDLIRESAYSLLGIIEDILDFSKIEADKLDIEAGPIAPGAIIEKACGLLDSLARKKDVELTVFVDPAIPALVLGDGLRIRQVLINIVNNAIKFSGGRPAMRGRVAVRAELAEATASQVWLSLRISDNGIGMDASTLAGLFTSFSQADVSTTRRFGGTGLGLAISHRLVDLMGGGITVQSVVGQGSTFVVRLPCTPLPQPLGVRGAFPIADLDCVVVSDAQESAQDHADYLRSAGARVERVRDLAAAGAWTARHRPAMTVWVVDAGSSPLHPDTWRDVTRMKTDMQLEVAAIGIDRTRRNGSGSTGQGMMLLDGNVLTRQRLLRAVAVVAGRMSEENFDTPAMVSSNALEAPSRDEAVRRGQLVLVVEDNETNQQVISRQLHLLGIAADVVGDGQAALQAWRSGDYSLIVTDLHMPVMDGYQLTRVIRAEEGRKRRIPIIALSANTVKEEAQRCLALGMNDYLSKPAQLSDLRRMLAKWLPAADIAALDTPATVAHAAAQYPADRASEATLVRAPVDVHVLEALVGDNVAVVAGFLRDFRKTAQDIVREILAAADTGSASGMAAGAHKLKSSARAVGAMELGELCSELEHLALVGRLSEAAEALMHLDTEMKRVARYLDSL